MTRPAARTDREQAEVDAIRQAISKRFNDPREASTLLANKALDTLLDRLAEAREDMERFVDAELRGKLEASLAREQALIKMLESTQRRWHQADMHSGPFEACGLGSCALVRAALRSSAEEAGEQ